MHLVELRQRVEQIPFWRIFGLELVSRQKVLELLNQAELAAMREARAEQAVPEHPFTPDIFGRR